MLAMDMKCGTYLSRWTTASKHLLPIDVFLFTGGRPAVDRLLKVFTFSSCRFASCGGDRQVFLWDVSTGKIIRKFRGHDSAINTVSVI